MARTAEQVATSHADDDYCTCCGRKLNPKTMVWLEKSFKTNRWYRADQCPPDQSQGNFAFGAACARNTLSKQST